MSAQHRRNPDMFPRTNSHIYVMSDADREEQARQYKEQEMKEIKEDMEYDKMKDDAINWESPVENTTEKELLELRRNVQVLADALHEIVASAIRHRWKVNSDEPDTINGAMDVLKQYKEGKL